MTYVLTEENSLDLSFKAIATKPTPINLANHVYFNLGEAIMNCFGTETNYTIIVRLSENFDIKNGSVVH